jgi:hypothetical protein
MNQSASMLHEFLRTHRNELIARCRTKAAKRAVPGAKPASDVFGIPQFLAQLTETLRSEQTPEALARRKAIGHGRPSLALVPPDIPSTAAKHGEELRRSGLTIDQVVHGYGDLCQSLTELAMEKDAPITVDEFHTFNRCLDDAIADAVTAYSEHGDTDTDTEGLGPPRSDVRTMRALVGTALLTFDSIKLGEVGLKGTTALLHERSLKGLRDVLDGMLKKEEPPVDLSATRP